MRCDFLGKGVLLQKKERGVWFFLGGEGGVEMGWLGWVGM